jgi:hypothetical protein
MTKNKYTLESYWCGCLGICKHPEIAIYENGNLYLPVQDEEKGKHLVNCLNLFEEEKVKPKVITASHTTGIAKLMI